MIQRPDTHPLVLYFNGQISSAVAVRSLKIRDHAALLVYLGDAGLPIPLPSEAEIEEQVATFPNVMPVMRPEQA
ncbi:hypothetical protein [Neorhizobium sp. T6_25]|uniref:hypothetical protein n=1 Tax=Neorhizobium sp. T6_25 TaxID=2093833 RepID=UPI000CF84E21|nr:hypothetical protein [Neorhizobium sp. T6_25]